MCVGVAPCLPHFGVSVFRCSTAVCCTSGLTLVVTTVQWMSVNLSLLWSEFAETYERRFDLLLQVLITHGLSPKFV